MQIEASVERSCASAQGWKEFWGMLSFLHSFNMKCDSTINSLEFERIKREDKEQTDCGSTNKRNLPLGMEKANHCGSYVNGTSKDKRPVITDER